MIKKPYTVVIESYPCKFTSAAYSRLSVALNAFNLVVNWCLKGDLHADAVRLMINDYVDREFVIYKRNVKCVKS